MGYFKWQNLWAILVSLISVSQASEIDVRRYVEVKGSAILMVEPDQAKWHIKMRGESTSIEDASQLLSNAVNDLVGLLKKGGFSHEILSLGSISSGRYYEGYGDQRRFRGYYTQRMATVLLKDLSKRQVLEKVLLQNDKIEISGMIVESSTYKEWHRKVLVEAVEAAKEKADLIALTLDGSIGVPFSAQEEGFQVSPPISRANHMRSEASGSEVELEKLKYEARVEVKFELK